MHDLISQNRKELNLKEILPGSKYAPIQALH